MPQSKLPILIIEDSPEDYEALARAFTKAGVLNPLYRFAYGEDAVDFLLHRGRYFKLGAEERPGFLILDLNLPGTDGLRVLQAVRADHELRSLPVIVLSTSASPRDVEASYASGANAYLVKPSGPDELLEVARRIRAFWLESATLPAKPESPEIVIPRAGDPAQLP